MDKHDADRNGSSLSRHSFLRVAGATALAASSAELFDIREVLAAPVVRKDVGGLTASSPVIKSYIKAIKAMQALPSSNHLSWACQAAIHGTTLSGPAPWNTCEHGTEWFWSWHRIYLHWFEKIIRKMSGDASWALPFWAWDSASERQIPAMFRDSSSVLYSPNRTPAMNTGAGSLSAGAVDYSVAFATPVYHTSISSGANDMFQGTPHGMVHGGVGSWFDDILTAALDPLFYLHHSNCDRLWQVWRGSYAGIDPVSDATWTGKKHEFYNAAGKPVYWTACQVLNAAKQLNYVYQGGPSLALEHCAAPFPFIPIAVLETLFRFVIPPVLLGQQRTVVPIPVPGPLREKLTQLSGTANENVYLQLNGIETPTRPGVAWETYVGLPANATPDPSGPFFVGNVVLFGPGIQDQMAGSHASLSLRINHALRAASQMPAAPLTVTFVPTSGILVNGKPYPPQVLSSVRIGQMTIMGETIKRQG